MSVEIKALEFHYRTYKECEKRLKEEKGLSRWITKRQMKAAEDYIFMNAPRGDLFIKMMKNGCTFSECLSPQPTSISYFWSI